MYAYEQFQIAVSCAIARYRQVEKIAMLGGDGLVGDEAAPRSAASAVHNVRADVQVARRVSQIVGLGEKFGELFAFLRKLPAGKCANAHLQRGEFAQARKKYFFK